MSLSDRRGRYLNREDLTLQHKVECLERKADFYEDLRRLDNEMVEKRRRLAEVEAGVLAEVSLLPSEEFFSSTKLFVSSSRRRIALVYG